MIKLNVKQAIKDAEIARSRPKPAPVIKITGSTPAKKEKPAAQKPNQSVQKVLQEAVLDRSRNDVKSDLLRSLWTEYNAILTERNKLSTQIAHLVEDDADESRLMEQYNKIEGYRPGLQDLYDKIQYVQMHGHLPEAPQTIEEPETIYSLKVKQKAIIDKRCKLKAKLAKKQAYNPNKYVEWELELEQANVLYNELTDKIKKLQG
jgi:hypothetical protein